MPIFENGNNQNLRAPELANLILNDHNYSKVIDNLLIDIKHTADDALSVFDTLVDGDQMRGMHQLGRSGRSESTCESSQIGSLCFGEDLGVQDIQEIADTVAGENCPDLRLAAFKVFHLFNYF